MSDIKKNLTSRRRFITGVAIVGALTTLEVSSFQSYISHSAEPRKPALSKGVIVANPHVCSGCRSCQAACTTYNDGWCQPDLSRVQIAKEYFEGNYTPQPCSQCEYPPCLYACPVGALQLDTGSAEGEVSSNMLNDFVSGKGSRTSGSNARIVNTRECKGCQQCIEGCAKAFDLSRIRFDSESLLVMKCHLCGGQPQCVRFCPVGALLYAYSEDGVLTGYDGEGNIRLETIAKALREDELYGVLWKDG